MTLISDKSASSAYRRSKRVYLPRIVGLALGGLCVGAAIWATPQSELWVWALLLANVLVWPHLAYRWTLHVTHLQNAETINLIIDSLMGGFWVVAMQGNLLPSVLVIAMLMMNNIAMGGFRLLSQGVLAHIAGALVGLGFFGWNFQPEANLTVQLFCLVFLVFYPMLIGRVTYQLVQQLSKQRADMNALSEYDTLSDMHNRRFFEKKIAGEFQNFKRYHFPMTLIVADIDNFKKINEHHGHAVGDAVIRRLSQVFRRQVRAADVSARIGGDEFAVLMPFTEVSSAKELAQRLQFYFAEAVADDHRLLGATLSFGIAAPHPDMQSHENWLELADKALYLAKTRKCGYVELPGAEQIP